MLILAIDSSGPQGSIALARGDAASFELVDSVPVAGGTFSAQLIPQLANLLEQHRLKKEEIAGIAVASGPGSFTGLRVGLAAAKALAEIFCKPIAAVSVLEAIACASGAEGRVVALLDAKRGEIYVGEYVVQGDAVSKSSENLVSAEDLVSRATGWHGATLVTTNSSLSQWLPGTAWKVIAWPGSQEVARLGLRKILAGNTVSVEALDANYIRRSDAEIFSPPQPRGGTRVS